MRIHTLTIENFRCFERQAFEFSPQFNVFIGENGKGKTAVLDALAVGVGAFLVGIGGVSTRVFVDDDIRVVNHREGRSVRRADCVPVKVTCVGAFSDMGRGWTPHYVWGGIWPDGLPGTWSRSLRGRGRRIDFSGAKEVAELSVRAVTAANQKENVVFPVIAFYGAARILTALRERRDDGGIDGPASRGSGYKRCLDPSSDVKAFRRWMKRYELIALQQGRPPMDLEVVRAAAIAAIPQCTGLWWDVELAEILVEIEGRTASFRTLSDGQQTMLALVTDLARRCITLNPQLEERACAETPGVVMIDEIDLHLHPKWQRRVIDDLRRIFPKVQFFATTHSPFIIQSLRAGELINLDGGEWTGEPMSVEDIASEVQGVEDVERSKAFNEMRDLANEYYDLLERMHSEADEARLGAVKKRLHELDERFATNPAVATFLQRERVAAEGTAADDGSDSAWGVRGRSARPTRRVLLLLRAPPHARLRSRARAAQESSR
jgi:predicted ATP-binding protein involved in virulence